MRTKKYSEEDILSRLDGAVSSLVPDITETLMKSAGEKQRTAARETAVWKPQDHDVREQNVWEQPNLEQPERNRDNRKQGNREEWDEVVNLPEEKRRRKRTLKRRLTAGLVYAAAACLILVAGLSGLSYRAGLAVDSIIGIDVNPSIEITTNHNDKVIEVKALNADAETIIGTMDFRNVDYEIVINALIGSLVRNGYFAEAKNYILVSVENDDAAKAEQMRNAITADINSALAAGQREAVVMNQQLSDTAGADSISSQYGVSRNMAAFLEKLVELKPELRYEDLAAMSLSELVEFARVNSINLEAVLDYMEDDDDFDEGDLNKPMDQDDIEDVKEDLEDLSGNNGDSGVKETNGQSGAGNKRHDDDCDDDDDREDDNDDDDDRDHDNDDDRDDDHDDDDDDRDDDDDYDDEDRDDDHDDDDD